MTRRTFAGAAAGSSVAFAAGAAPQNACFELRWIRMRTNADDMLKRTSAFIEKTALPALARAGVGPIGVFSSVIAPDAPFLLMLMSYPSLAAMEASLLKMAQDETFQKERAAFDALPGLSYVRVESSLLRAFDSLPAIEIPPAEGRRAARIFELRVYESNNASTLQRKIRMFDQGEIAIFRKTGLQPVFFGMTLVGRNMPNLTYMVAFDDLASREKNWRAFGADPEWQKLRSQPGFGDAEIVSGISNSILRPLPFSAIR